MRFMLCARLLFAAMLLIAQPAVQAASRPPVAAEHGMVVTAQHLATQVGVDVLKAGGNAVDAAVAVGYTLAVVYPAAGNLGGGGFMTVVFADGRKTFLDFREQAPLAATPGMYLDADGNVIPGASTRGYLAAGVPGTVSGLEYAREKYGTMRRATLIAPAIRYARAGYVLEAGDVAMLQSATGDFRKDTASAAIFLRHGEPYRAGEKLVQRDLARTLRLIGEHGADGFYRGEVGRAIVAGMQQGGGIVAQADLDRYRTRELQPVECSYRGYGIVSAPPPSSGGVTLCEMLNVLSGYPLHDLGYRSAQAMQYQIEAMRHAYVDRNNYLGDPDFVHNPLDRLLSQDYAAQIRAAIDPQRAGDSSRLSVGVAPHEGANTTHYSIVDRWGNAVSVTYTLNEWFGARVTVPHSGVLLNDEMDDFTIKPGLPNAYGLVQGVANSIAPGKRPLSSMTPTVVTQDGKPLLVLGTPGGSRIITVVLLTILNVIDYGMDIQQAVDAPRFHQQWLPDYTNLEPDAISPEVQRTLEGWGQKFGPPQEVNHVAAILVGAPELNGRPVGIPSPQSSDEATSHSTRPASEQVAGYPASGRGGKCEKHSLVSVRYYGANDNRRGTGLALGY